MKVNNIAFMAGLQMFRFKFTGSFIQLYKAFCPLLNTPILNESIAAPSCPSDNSAYSSYLSSWSVQSMYGLQQWFRLLSKISQTVNLTGIFSHTILKQLIQQHSKVNMTTQLIPIVYNRGDFADIRFVTYNEYVTVKHLTANQFVSHIGQLVLFGLVADPETVEALRLHSVIASYILFRIKQGQVDKNFSSSITIPGIYNTSSFDQPLRKNQNSELLTSKLILNLLRTSKKTSKGVIVPDANRLNKLVTHLRSLESVGGSRDELKGLAKMGAFKKVNPDFNKYLMTDNKDFDLYGLGRFEQEVNPFSQFGVHYESREFSNQVDRRPRHQVLFGNFGGNGEQPIADEVDEPIDVGDLMAINVNSSEEEQENIYGNSAYSVPPIQLQKPERINGGQLGIVDGDGDYDMSEPSMSEHNRFNNDDEEEEYEDSNFDFFSTSGNEPVTNAGVKALLEFIHIDDDEDDLSQIAAKVIPNEVPVAANVPLVPVDATTRSSASNPAAVKGFPSSGDTAVSNPRQSYASAAAKSAPAKKHATVIPANAHVDHSWISRAPDNVQFNSAARRNDKENQPPINAPKKPPLKSILKR